MHTADQTEATTTATTETATGTTGQKSMWRKIRRMAVAGVMLAATVSLFPSATEANYRDQTRVLNLRGEGVMYLQDMGDLDGDGISDQGMCFTVPLYDLERNDREIGTGTDCLSLVTPSEEGGVALTGTAIFDVRKGSRRGQLVTRAATSVRPVLQPTSNADGRNFTHITGANSGENAVVSSDRGFRNASGTARLSGMVDMSSFNGEEGDTIYFDCVFIIEFDAPGTL